ncbi:uncharacterized protein LOC135847932 [Planococcus citri]|uniref:uncharacterized protein LOC135847932 n=1 Tax=Planococcus citri TaxID=170843 RepID=UPI0031F99690
MASDSSNEYSPSTLYVSDDKRLMLMDKDTIRDQWVEESNALQKDYFKFTQNKYFVNNLGILPKIVKSLRTLIFNPTGCMKTATSYGIEKFFSMFVKEDERRNLEPVFLGAVTKEFYDKYSHQYIVFRMSFQSLTFMGPVNTAEDEINGYIFRKFCEFLVLHKWSLETEEEKYFLRTFTMNGLFCAMMLWLKKKTNKHVVVILDEINSPLMSLFVNNYDASERDTIWKIYSNILNRLSTCTSSVKFAIAFGIHVVRILDWKEWKYVKLSDLDYTKYFMFDKNTVEKIIDKYKGDDGLIFRKTHQETMDIMTQCYGGYSFDLYCPSSVVRYLENNGERKLYKWHRRTIDIMDVKESRVHLAVFLDAEEHIVNLKPSLDLRTVAQNGTALANYVYAGLLRVEVSPSAFPDGDYKVSVGNLENLNIVGYFLEQCKGK